MGKKDHVSDEEVAALGFSFKTKPLSHQFEEFKKFLAERGTIYRGLWWDPGLGKTKEVLDEAAWLFMHGRRVTRLLVIAPKGVHHGWAYEQPETHLPTGVPFLGMAWYSERAGLRKKNKKLSRKQYETEQEHKALCQFDGLAILAMGWATIMTEKGWLAAQEFLRSGPAMVVLDESRKIKGGRSKTAMRLLYGDWKKGITGLSAQAKYRRVLDGTPNPHSPFDFYNQIQFLESSYWARRGMGSRAAFKARFAEWQTRYRMEQNPKTGKLERKEYEELITYRNIDELQEYVQDAGSRVLKEDVLDLPPRTYSTRHFELEGEHREIYENLRDKCWAELADGSILTAMQAMTLILRLQQVTCGYAPVDGELRHISDSRLDLLDESLDDITGQVIIWSRFKDAIERIMERLGDKAVRYDGSTSGDDRVRAIEGFQRGDIQYFVSNPAAGGSGLTLTAAETMVYYASDFDLANRLQSEDRNYRIGQTKPTHIIDFVALNTIDVKILNALRGKKEIMSLVLGDGYREWI